jgi:hypothetical protein
LSVRTIQRIENGTHPGLESLKLLARAFGVEVAELHAQPPGPLTMSFLEATRHCLAHYADFIGHGSRPEFWWFSLAVSLAMAIAAAIGPWLTTIAGAMLLLPWLAAAARRIRDAGESPWWLLMLPVPVGGLVIVAVLCAMPSAAERDQAQAAT